MGLLPARISILALLATSALCTGTVAPKVVANFDCAAKEPSAALQDAHRQLSKVEKTIIGRDTLFSVDVDVYMHVITSPQTGRKPFSNYTVKRQIDTLNDNFRPAGINFHLRGIDWTVYYDLIQDNNVLSITKPLRKGGVGTLNIYIADRVGWWGKSTFPDMLQNDNGFINDGCIISASTTPGSDDPFLNEGKTATHEVGHWFGLLHTFQGGCEGEGDEVSDTPSSMSMSDGCPVGRDSCPNQQGSDPIHNYMDYTDDACKTEFSPGQISRLHSLWQRFRRPIKDCGSSNFTEENCGTKLFCQLYDMPNTRPDNRFKNGLDCLADREPDKFCALYGHPQKPDDRFKNVADCLAALSPELKCMMYDLPKSRRPDSRFNDRSDCQADLARSCHIYNDPLMRPDERFKDGTDCLVNQAPDKFCQLYDTDQRPDNAFKNRADCLEERAPVMFCLLYDYPKLKPDDKFKNRSECVTARRIKSSPTNNNNNNKVRSAISAT